MPVRSLHSSVLRWPERQTVDACVRRLAADEAACRPELVALGYYGSYARGDWGVGSDLDVIAIVTASQEPFEARAAKWDISHLPVPADFLVYTLDEWRRVVARDDRFARMLTREVVWVVGDPRGQD